MSTQHTNLEALLGADPYAALLGIRFCEGGPGYAVVEMDVADQHINFLNGGHGGAIFSIADTAFGLASNSYDKISIGIDAHIAYVKGAVVGDRLTARAREISRTRRTAAYRVDVTSGDNMIATFTGTVHVSSRDHAGITEDHAP